MRHSGEIRWQGRTLYISESLAGEPVGLAEQDDGVWAAWYGPVTLGSIDQGGRFSRPQVDKTTTKGGTRMSKNCYPCRRSKLLPIFPVGPA